MEDGHRPLPAGQDVERVPDGLQGRNTKDTSILVRKHYMNQLLQTITQSQRLSKKQGARSRARTEGARVNAAEALSGVAASARHDGCYSSRYGWKCDGQDRQ